MKIQDVQTFVVGNPPPRFGGACFVFVKLTGDDGVSGYAPRASASNWTKRWRRSTPTRARPCTCGPASDR